MQMKAYGLPAATVSLLPDKLRGMKNTYVLDTNVLLHDPNALFAFEENHVVIPLSVVEEIDNHKKRQDEIGRNARAVSRRLDELRSVGQLSEGVRLPTGGILHVEINHQAAIEFPWGLDPKKYDNRILAVVHNLQKEKTNRAVLVSKDLNLRIKADVMGISAEDYHNDKVDYRDLYAGFREIHVAPEELNRFYGERRLKWDRHPAPYPQEFVVLKNSAEGSQSALCRYLNGAMHPLIHEESFNWGVKARNKEQKFALELLLNDSIKVITLVGSAGTGKTLLALAVGLEKVLEKGDYKRLLIMRPVIPVGDDLGYLPGTKEEKLRPWMQPIYDNLEYLFRESADPFHVLDHHMDRGVIQLETFTYIRGRSIPGQFILCDEAQNLTPNMIKALITRVGEGTKIVLTGDPEQIDHPYLDSSSNGLTYLVEKLKEQPFSGHVRLVKGERSMVAEMGAKLL
jgi:PhoH-like ATPase